MALKENSPSCQQGLTPPNSPTAESVMPSATLKDLKHLSGVFEKVLSDLANREPTLLSSRAVPRQDPTWIN